MAYSALVIDKAWTPTLTSNDKYVTVKQEENSALSSGSVTPVTPAINSLQKLSGNKVLIFLDINTGGADVVADLFLELSPDGTNWTQQNNLLGTDYITVSTDINPNTEGVKVFMIDLTDWFSPYFRIGFNSAGNNLGTDIKFQMGYSYKI